MCEWPLTLPENLKVKDTLFLVTSTLSLSPFPPSTRFLFSLSGLLSPNTSQPYFSIIHRSAHFHPDFPHCNVSPLSITPRFPLNVSGMKGFSLKRLPLFYPFPPPSSPPPPVSGVKALFLKLLPLFLPPFHYPQVPTPSLHVSGVKAF